MLRRHQRWPWIGSPAVSFCSSSFRTGTIRGFFFEAVAAAAGSADAAGQGLARCQFAAAAGDCRRIHAQQGRRPPVAAVAPPQRLQAREPAPLPLVQRPGEGLQPRGVVPVSRGVAGRRRLELLERFARRALAPPRAGVGGRVPVAAVAPLARHAAAGREPPEGVAGADLQQGVKFLDAEAVGGLGHERGEGVEEAAAGGEAHAAKGPQTVGIEAGTLGEHIEAAVVGVAGVMRDLMQLAHGRAPGGGAEGGHELGHGGHGLALQQLDESVGGVLGGPHSVAMAALYTPLRHNTRGRSQRSRGCKTGIHPNYGIKVRLGGAVMSQSRLKILSYLCASPRLVRSPSSEGR